MATSTLGVSAVVAQDGSPTGLRPVEDPLFGVSSVVPEDWQDLGSGAYARGTPPEDMALIAIQSAQATPDDLWPALLPQFAIDQVPDVTGTLASERFDWTLYQFNVTLGELSVSVELALAEDGGSTHLVLLQSDPEEFAALREQVFVPAVEAFDVLAPEPTPDPATLGYAVEEVIVRGWQRGHPAGRHADAAARTGSAPGGRAHDRQRCAGPRRVDAPGDHPEALRHPGRCPDLSRRGRAALRRSGRGRQQRRLRVRHHRGPGW